MLSNQAKLEIMNRLSFKVGYTISEASLSPEIRKKITILTSVQRSFYIIQEISRGERARVNGSVVLRIASKLHSTKDASELVHQIEELNTEIENKINDISKQILTNETSESINETLDGIADGTKGVIELTCTKCGAPLPLPTGKFLKCSYCGEGLFIQDITPQLRSIVKRI